MLLQLLQSPVGKYLVHPSHDKAEVYVLYDAVSKV